MCHTGIHIYIIMYSSNLKNKTKIASVPIGKWNCEFVFITQLIKLT